MLDIAPFALCFIEPPNTSGMDPSNKPVSTQHPIIINTLNPKPLK